MRRRRCRACEILKRGRERRARLTLADFQHHLHPLRGADSAPHAVQALACSVRRGCRRNKEIVHLDFRGRQFTHNLTFNLGPTPNNWAYSYGGTATQIVSG